MDSSVDAYEESLKRVKSKVLPARQGYAALWEMRRSKFEATLQPMIVVVTDTLKKYCGDKIRVEDPKIVVCFSRRKVLGNDFTFLSSINDIDPDYEKGQAIANDPDSSLAVVWKVVLNGESVELNIFIEENGFFVARSSRNVFQWCVEFAFSETDRGVFELSEEMYIVPITEDFVRGFFKGWLDKAIEEYGRLD